MKGYLTRFSGTLIAALILILLVGYIYFFQMRKPVKEKKEKVFPTLGEKQINEIDLKYPLYMVVCRKEGEIWFIFKGPQKFKADDKIISGMAENISQMKIEKVIFENPTNLPGFGLSSPQVEVVAKTPEKKYRILIGDESPVGSGIYIRIDNDSRVLIVSRGSVLEFLGKSANDLRDKQILSLEKVNALEVKTGDTRILILKKGNDWELNDGKNIKVSGTKVQEFLEEIEGLEIEKFVDDEPEDLAPYGLDKPGIQIIISESNKKKTLLFGKRENGKVYVKLADAKSVYLVSDEILSKIPSRDALIKK